MPARNDENEGKKEAEDKVHLFVNSHFSLLFSIKGSMSENDIFSLFFCLSAKMEILFLLIFLPSVLTMMAVAHDSIA